MIKFNKGTIFKNIPQGFDENGNLKYVDRPLLNDLIITEEDVGEVLKEYEAHQTPVPSYEKWRESYNCMLENEVLRLKNAQLKELLKECKEVIKNVDTYYGNYDSTNGYLVINKINEALR